MRLAKPDGPGKTRVPWLAGAVVMCGLGMLIYLFWRTLLNLGV